MPAPTSIRIRYGDAGLLGSAVAAAASAEAAQRNYDQQHASDMALIGQFLDHKNRTDEIQMQSALEDNKLQAAYALQRANNNARQPVDPYAYGNPSADAGSALKTAMLNNSPIGDTGKMSLKDLVNRRDITPEQFRSVVFEAEKTEKNAQTEATKAKSREQKSKYVEAATKGMNPQDAASIASMVDDDNVSLAQIRTAADSIHNRSTVLPRTQLAMATAGIDKQQSVIRSQMETIARSLTKLGVNPETVNPASFNPTYRDPSQGVAGFGARINDKLNPFSNSTGLITPNPNADAFKAYKAYHRLKQQFNALAAQRQALLTNGGNPSAAPAVDKMSDAELLAALQGQ